MPKLNFKIITAMLIAVVALTLPDVAMAAFDPATETSGSDSKSWIETAGQWMLGVVVVIWGIRRTLGFFGK
ncbi:hypothetical protein AVENLUH5627_02107 [Acinetobacter venetianus]|uniref:Bacteriophage coat protein B n=1 Tax=Acinetobacter venetianus TaxID=52133 RepID=A0A150HNE1_9GAMM|nr:hypothetical protein [Acinetobacter venetianus]KXZ67578.1 hypothetical protein AVENLUH5627_02107 [Acinetobacter venetianus]